MQRVGIAEGIEVVVAAACGSAPAHAVVARIQVLVRRNGSVESERSAGVVANYVVRKAAFLVAKMLMRWTYPVQDSAPISPLFVSSWYQSPRDRQRHRRRHRLCET